MSAIREQTYRRYARPKAFGAAMLKPNRLSVAIMWLILAFCIVLALGIVGWQELVAPRVGPGAFYEVVPFAVMTIPAFIISGSSLILMCVGVLAYWRDTADHRVTMSSVWRSLSAALTLENMEGGGPGCTYPGELPEKRRRIMHSLVFYGFSATFLSTILAAIWQELLGELPPYPLISPPVIVGTLGGLAIVSGCVGLLSLKSRSRRELDHDGIRRLDIDFMVLLLSINATGLLLLLARSTLAMGPLLVVHLGLIAAFFATLPYGKFVHATYRSAALLQDALERETNHDG
jgi:citrate/tricarballylate utilization protein